MSRAISSRKISLPFNFSSASAILHWSPGIRQLSVQNPAPILPSLSDPSAAATTPLNPSTPSCPGSVPSQYCASLSFSLIWHSSLAAIHSQLALIIRSRSSPISGSVSSACIQHSMPYSFSVACTSPRFHQPAARWPLPRCSLPSDCLQSGFPFCSPLLSSSTHRPGGQVCCFVFPFSLAFRGFLRTTM